MDEEDEKKKKKRDWGSIVINVVRMAKYMSNPVVYYAVIILLIIVIVIGFISYFLSLPGQILGAINKFLKDVGDFLGNGQITVDQEEVEELCAYLEEMGYDVEAYGFVETLERKSDKKTYDDEKFDNNTPTRGTIKDGTIKSRYLEAYIISEKKLYAISNESNYLMGTINEEYYMFEALQAARDSVLAKFETIKDKLDDKIGEYIKAKDLEDTQDLRLDIKSSIVVQYAIEMYQSSNFFNYSNSLLLRGLMQVFGTLQSDFIKWLREEDNTNFENELQQLVALELANLNFDDYKYGGDGLIFLENNTAEAYKPLGGDWVYNGEEKPHHVEIDRDNKLFKVKTDLPDKPIIMALGLNKLSVYAYDLNNWTTKYGKSQDFLIATHIATMAPDFTYKLATSSAVDTKVHVALYETNINLQVVIGEKSDVSVLSLINQANENKAILNEVYNRIRKIITDNLSYNDIPSKRREIITQNIQYYYLSTEEPEALPYSNIGLPEWGTELSDEDVKSYVKIQSIIEYLVELRGAKSVTEIFKKFDDLNISNPTITKEINELKDTKIGELGVKLEDNLEYIKELKLGEIEKAISFINEMEESLDVATPYITKVVRHWYRNQYFTDVGGDVWYYKKQRCKELVYNVYNIILNGGLDLGDALDSEDRENVDEFYDVNQNQKVSKTIDDMYKKIDSIPDEDNESINKFIDDLEETCNSNQIVLTNGDKTKTYKIDEDNMPKIQNEFTAIRKQFGDGDNDLFSGGAYKVEANPEPFWYLISELVEKGFEFDESIDQSLADFLMKFAIKEQRDHDLVQIHNPLFEDNSLYIRSWLKDKYTIYNGKNVSSNKDDSILESGTQEGYIQGKEALRELEAQMEQVADVRADMVYMIRNLKELFQDFEFDLENRDVQASKVLTSIMPDYVPYTPWPSVYETNESNYTKIIYKGQSEGKADGTVSTGTVTADIVAPEKCIVRNISDGIMDIEFSQTVGNGVLVLGMTLRIQAEDSDISFSVKKGDEVEKGTKIGTISGNPAILKLSMFTGKKQIVKIEDYMEIKSKEYEDLTEDEKGYLYGLLTNEIKNDDEKIFEKGNAIVSVILNRILSPLYPEEKGIIEVLKNYEEIGFTKFEMTKDLEKLEQSVKLKTAISSALRGADLTRTETLLGATFYYRSALTQGDELTRDLLAKVKANKFKTYKVIDNMLFGVKTSEYKQYLKMIIGKKIDEVMYELDLKKYLEGIEESEGGYDTSSKIIAHQNEVEKIFEQAKNSILDYYSAGTYIDECGGIKFAETDTLIKTLEKNNIYQEQEEKGDETVITDHFTLTADANYGVKWTISYTIGKEGKVLTSKKIDIQHQAITNY